MNPEMPPPCKSDSVNSKHGSTTPQRKESKSVKHKKEGDVHSTPPVTPKRLLASMCANPPPLWSPSHFNSQDVPAVVWGNSYPIGDTRGKWNVTAEDSAKAEEGLHPHHVFQTPSPDRSSSKLRKNWMSSDSIGYISPDPEPKPQKKPERKRQFRSHIELMQLLNLIRTDCSSNGTSNSARNVENAVPEHSVQSSSTGIDVKNPDLENGSGSDSVDELWGDEDPNFLIKATQFSIDVENEMDNKMSMGFNSLYNTSPGVSVSSVPAETFVPLARSNSKCVGELSCPTEESTGVKSLECVVLDKTVISKQKHPLSKKKSTFYSKLCSLDSQASHQLLKSKSFSDVSRPSCHISEEMPHTVIADGHTKNSSKVNLRGHASLDKLSSTVSEKHKEKYTFSKKFAPHEKNKQTFDFCDRSSICPAPGTFGSQIASVSASEKKQSRQRNDNRINSEAYYDNIQSVPGQNFSCVENSNMCTLDSSLERALDDPVILEPETLKWLDEVESQAYSQTKCSAAEIEQKKAAAMERLKQRQLLRKGNESHRSNSH